MAPLNANRLGSLPAGDHPDGIVPGMFLRVGKRARTFCLRYRVPGSSTQRTFKLGRADEVTLAEARARGKMARDAVAEGRDPSYEKDERILEAEEVRSATFRLVSEAMLESRAERRSLRPRTLKTYRALLTGINAVLGDVPISELRRADVYRLRDSFPASAWTSNHSVKLVSMIFSEILERDPRGDLYGVEYNPALNVEQRKLGERSRFLEREEIRSVWSATMTERPDAALLARLALLTAQRVNEVCSIRWEDIKGNVWTIPAERYKGRRAHAVPLSAEVLELLEAFPGRADVGYLFPAVRAANSGAEPAQPWRTYPNALLRRLRSKAGLSVSWGFHDFRRSFSTHATRKLEGSKYLEPGLGVDEHIARAVLGHKDSSVRGNHYVGDKLGELLEDKGEALEAWGAFVRSAVGELWNK